MRTRDTTVLTVLMLLICADARASLISHFNFTISDCTSACDSIAFLAVGTTISGALELDVANGEVWTAADLVTFDSQWSNPAAPFEPFDGDNLTTVNPFVFDLQSLNVQTGPAGPDNLISGGTSTGNGQIDSGTLMLEVRSNGFSTVWMILTIDSVSQASLRLCLFFESIDCIPQATRAVLAEGCFNLTVEGCRPGPVPLPAAFWLLLCALGALGATRRAKVKHGL